MVKKKENNRKEYFKLYRLRNKEKIKQKNAEYYLKNKEKILKRNEKWRKENSEKVLENHRKYKSEHRDEYRELNRKQYQKDREKIIKKIKKYRNTPENREKILAMKKANHYIRIKKPCEKCGSTERIHKHHPDYNRPLDVKFLCSIHHAQEHYGGGFKSV